MGKIMCKLFGHAWPKRGWWGDGLYGILRGGYTDNVGRSHYQVQRECERCGEQHITARFHGNKVYEDHLKEEINAQRSFAPVMDNPMQFLRHFAATYGKPKTNKPMALSPAMVEALCAGIDQALKVSDTFYETASGRVLTDEEKFGWSKLGIPPYTR